MGVLLGFTTFTDVDQDGVTVVTLLGLGLAVDYGLLLVARYREELRAGYELATAVARAWASAGRTVLFSALTVAAALSGLLLFRVPTLTALGAAGVSIAVVCMLASLTFTAALIGLLRRWIKPSRRARLAEADEAERGAFARISRWVQRRPLVVALGTMALLLIAGAPLLATELRLPGLEGIPRSIESARVADTLSARFARPADTRDHRGGADRPGDAGRLGGEVGRRAGDIPGTAGASAARQRPVRKSYVDGRVGRARRSAGRRGAGPRGPHAGRPPARWAILGHRRCGRAQRPDGAHCRGAAGRDRHHGLRHARAAVRDDRLAGGTAEGDHRQPDLPRRDFRCADRGVPVRLRQPTCWTRSPSARSIPSSS